MRCTKAKRAGCSSNNCLVSTSFRIILESFFFWRRMKRNILQSIRVLLLPLSSNIRFTQFGFKISVSFACSYPLKRYTNIKQSPSNEDNDDAAVDEDDNFTVCSSITRWKEKYRNKGTSKDREKKMCALATMNIVAKNVYNDVYNYLHCRRERTERGERH